MNRSNIVSVQHIEGLGWRRLCRLQLLLQSHASDHLTPTTVAAQSVQEIGAQAFVPDTMQALSTQTTILASIHDTLTQQPTCAYLDARGPDGGIDNLQQRMHIWETSILPEILDRLPLQAPKTPDDRSQPSQQEEQAIPTGPTQQPQDEERQELQQTHETVATENDTAQSSLQRTQTSTQETLPYPSTPPRILRPVGNPTDVLEILDYRSRVAKAETRAMRPFNTRS